MTDSASISDPRAQAVTQTFKCSFITRPRASSSSPTHPTALLGRGGILTSSKVPWPPSALDKAQQSTSCTGLYWKFPAGKAAGQQQHTQSLLLRPVPPCTNNTFLTFPGRSWERFLIPCHLELLLCHLFGSRGSLFISHGCSGTGMYQWSRCLRVLCSPSSCAWQHFQREEQPAVTARLCHLPASPACPVLGFPLPASMCLCPWQTHGHMASVTTIFSLISPASGLGEAVCLHWLQQRGRESSHFSWCASFLRLQGTRGTSSPCTNSCG